MSSVVRFLFPRLDICGAFVRLEDVWQAMREGRDYSPVVASLLGELAATVVLIAAQLKSQGKLTLQLKGNGPVSLLLVECDKALCLRGMARAEDCPPNARVPELLGAGKGGDSGEGQLLLTLAQEAGVYQSMVPLAGDSVAAIFSHYLAQSDQQEARLFLAADETVAAGLFLQKMPTADTLDADGWTRLTYLAGTVRPKELLGLEAETLLLRLFPEDAMPSVGAPVGVLFSLERAIHCHCPDNREKLAALIKSWGRGEAEAILAERGVIEIQDEISNRTYRFDKDDLAKIFA